MATRKPMKKFKRYEGGGEVMGSMDPQEAADKQRGLDISNKEAPVGFFERLRAGNIDQPGSEAYNRFGAGRGRDRGESVSVNQPMPAAPAAPAASSRPLSDDMYSDYGSSTGAGAAGTSETIKPTRQVMTKPTLPVKPAAPNKQSTGFYMPPETRDKPNYSNEGRGKPAPAAPAAPAKPTMDTKTMNDNAKKAMSDDPSSLLGMAGAGAAALFGASKLGKMFKGAKKAADKASPYLKEIPMDKKKLSGPKKSSDVTDVVAKKRGGAVKKYASGGMVSSASKRADGIASKGKTRCKIC
jgi:hypothetical protein